MGKPIGSLDVVAAEEHDHETAREYRCCCELLHARNGIRVFAAITLLINGVWVLIALFGIGAIALMPRNVTSSHTDELSNWFADPHASDSSPEEDGSTHRILRVIVTVVAVIYLAWPLIEFIFALLVFFGVARRKSRLIIPYMVDQLLFCVLMSALAVFALLDLFISKEHSRGGSLFALVCFVIYAAYTGLAAWTAWKTIRWVRHVKSCEGNRIRMSTIMTPPVLTYYKQ